MVLYFSILYIVSIAGNLFLAGAGGVDYGPGALIFGAIWAAVNFALLLTFGFPAVL